VAVTNFPWERFVRFVLSTKSDPNDVLRRIRLPVVSWDGTISRRARLRGAPRPPVVEAWFNGRATPIAGSEAFMAWARANEIGELWERRPEFARANPDVEAACLLFCNPGLRSIAGTMVLAEFPGTEIAELLYTRFDHQVTEGVIAAFRRLFWDPAFMSRDDWTSLLDDLEPEQRNLLVLAFSGKKKAFVRCALGGVPEVDYTDILAHITTTAFMRFQEIMDEPVPDDVAAQSWARMAMQAGLKHKQFGGGPRKSMGEELQLALRHHDPKLPTLADLGLIAAPPATDKTGG
jgi:hypothetical protein